MNSNSTDDAIFFDIHRHPYKQATVQMDLHRFLGVVQQGQLFDTDMPTVPCPGVPDADRALQFDADAWVDLEIALVWALTGKVADKETIYPYRDVFRSLLKQYGLQNSFRLSVVCAYLICAARLKRNGWGAEDKNNVDDFKEFCVHLLDPTVHEIVASTFMCAHREADSNKLVQKLKTESFIRIINILRGIVQNLDDKRIRLAYWSLIHRVFVICYCSQGILLLP